MIINFTDMHQFHTRLQLKGQTIEIVPKMKILGTVVTDTLSWDENCAILVKKVNAWMQLLRKVWSYGSSKEEMVDLWKVFCRSILEQTCVLWDSGLTEQNRTDLERTQTFFYKIGFTRGIYRLQKCITHITIRNFRNTTKNPFN